MTGRAQHATAPATAPAATPAAPAVRTSDTVGRILATALRLFSEHGYERTSLREISDELGFTKAALYYHFRSKEDLLAAVLEPLLSELEALVRYASTQRVAAPREVFLGGYLELLMRHRALLRYLVNDTAAVVNSELDPRLKDLRAAALELVGGQATSLRERMRCAAALGALQAAIIVVEDGADEAEVRATALETVYRCLAPTRD